MHPPLPRKLVQGVHRGRSPEEDTKEQVQDSLVCIAGNLLWGWNMPDMANLEYITSLVLGTLLVFNAQ